MSGNNAAVVEQHLNLLGKKVEDKVTGLRGVIVSVAFDLYGCIQVVLDPGVKSPGELGDSRWFDVNRIVVTSEAPVMPVPDFTTRDSKYARGEHGPAGKPLPGA